MSTLKLKGSTSGYVEITAPATAGNNTITLPTTAGTILLKDPSNNIQVGTGVTIGSPTSNTFTVSTNGSERVIVNSFGNLGIGTTNPTTKLDVVGDGNFTGVVTAGRFGSPVLIGSATSTGTSSQNLQVTGGAYVSGSVGIGNTRPTSTLQITGGDTRLGGVIETVGTATTYMVAGAIALEMDVRQATVYTYTMPAGANISVVSFLNMPAQTGSPSGSTVTLLVTQNAAGTGNTTALTGIGTFCTVFGYENGSQVAGISTRGLVGSAVTTTLSTTGGDVDFISFFINYNGGNNTDASSYKVYVTKNGGFRRGNIGI